MSHTPGPWTLADPSYMAKGVEYVMAGTNEQGWQPEVAVIYSDDNQEANARLIAAAPDMLAALEAEQEWRYREEAGALDPDWDYEVMVGAKRRAAIAKAEGR